MNKTKRNMLLAVFMIGIALFNIADYFLTLHVLKLGCTEWNPLIAPLIGTNYLPVIKLVMIPLALAAIWFLKNRIGYRLIYYTGSVFSVYLLLITYFGCILCCYTFY